MCSNIIWTNFSSNLESEIEGLLSKQTKGLLFVDKATNLKCQKSAIMLNTVTNQLFVHYHAFCVKCYTFREAALSGSS